MNDVVQGGGKDVAQTPEDESWLAKVARRRLEGITLVALEKAGVCNIDTGFVHKDRPPSDTTELVTGDFAASPIFKAYFQIIKEQIDILKPYLTSPHYQLDTEEKVDTAAKTVLQFAMSNALTYLKDPQDRLNRINIDQALSAAAAVGVRRGSDDGEHSGAGSTSVSPR